MYQIIANNFENILKKVQICKSAHQKNLKILEQLYEKTEEQEFLNVLLTYLKKKLFPIKNEFVERILLFLAQFVAAMAPVNDNDETLEEEDNHSHMFLRQVVTKTLQVHNVQNESVRYNSCLFVRLVLQNIGHETRLDNDVCDFIQDAMLERTNDPKASIRQQAVLALIRLQDPLNPECPIIKAYLSLIVDSNSLIRAEVVKNIAPYSLTIPHILNRLKDIDVNVRIMALRRCADLGPKHFRIVERQHIINCGLTEDQPKAKKVFVDNLLMKWLNIYGRNFLHFFNALKLDADENDFITTEQISKDILKLIMNSVPIKEIITTLQLQNKLIPFENLTSEAVTVWNVVSNFLRQTDDGEEFLNEILPELTPFCDYIESITKKKNDIHPMAEWEYLNYQYIMYNLFEIVEKYDFSDEVGRRRLNQLIFTLLKDEEIQYRLLKKIVILAEQLKSKDDSFIDIICHLISEIREPLIEKIVPPEKNSELDFQKAQLRLKLNILEGQLEDAADMQEFLKANTLKDEIIKVTEELKNLVEPQPVIEVVKVSKDDPKTICRCLDLLIALLELPSTKKLSPFLITIKDEFVLPLLNNNTSEVNWRVLNCLGLYGLLDQELAEENVKILLIPIITYRAIPNYDKLALTISVKAISDLFRVYGSNIFGNVEETSQSAVSLNHTKRRLYRNGDDEESVIDPNRFHFESAIEIMLDMLDDENPDIRNCAILAIAKLILSNFPVTPSFITRLLLKWYNPLTAGMKDNVQQILGILIANYANSINGAREIISKAVVPILISISSAPRTSPLVDVDVDNMLQFLAAITNSGYKRDVVNTHLNLAHILCHEILKKKDGSVVLYLTRMLIYLDIPVDNVTAVNEIIAQVQNSLEEDTLDKLPKKYLQKFLTKLDNLLKQVNSRSSSLTTINENGCESTNENENNKINENDTNERESESDYVIENSSSDNLSVHSRVEANGEISHKNNQIENAQEKLQENNKEDSNIQNQQVSVEKAQKQIQDINNESPIVKDSQKPDSIGDTNKDQSDLSTDKELFKDNRLEEKNRDPKTKIGRHQNKKNNNIKMKKASKRKKNGKNNENELNSNEEHSKNSSVLNNSSTDSEVGRHNIKRRKGNNKVNNSSISTTSSSGNSNQTTTSKNDSRIKSKKRNSKQSNNDIKNDNDLRSPKRKKLKVLSVDLLNIDNLNETSKQNKQHTFRPRKTLTIHVTQTNINQTTEAQKKKVDGTLNYTDVNLSDCSFKPTVESTAIKNGRVPGSTLSKKHLRKSRESISRRNSKNQNLHTNPPEETILHTIEESSEMQKTRLSTSPFSSNGSFVSERSLRSRNRTSSSSPMSGSPVIRMQRISSKTPETGSHKQRSSKKTKKKM